MDSSKVFAMKLSKVHPLLVAKAQRKDGTAQEIEDPLVQRLRYFGKLVDKLAKGETYGEDSALVRQWRR